MALDLREDRRAELAAWRDKLIAGRDDLRPVSEEALHVTLAFLGWRAEKEIPAIANAIGHAYAETHDIDGFLHMRLEPGEVVSVPRRRPRLFALHLKDAGGAAAELQQTVSASLEAGRFYKPEKRPWWPHVTLARVKRGRKAEPIRGEPPAGELVAHQITLYRSTLRPQGALYERLTAIRLG